MAILVCGCGGGAADEAERAQTVCERLRDHVVELRLADTTGVDRPAHREALRQAMGDGFVASCQGSMTERQISCALDAVDLTTATACTGK